jgi:hypothetical protein
MERRIKHHKRSLSLPLCVEEADLLARGYGQRVAVCSQLHAADGHAGGHHARLLARAQVPHADARLAASAEHRGLVEEERDLDALRVAGERLRPFGRLLQVPHSQELLHAAGQHAAAVLAEVNRLHDLLVLKGVLAVAGQSVPNFTAKRR